MADHLSSSISSQSLVKVEERIEVSQSPSNVTNPPAYLTEASLKSRGKLRESESKRKSGWSVYLTTEENKGPSFSDSSVKFGARASGEDGNCGWRERERERERERNQ